LHDARDRMPHPLLMLREARLSEALRLQAGPVSEISCCSHHCPVVENIKVNNFEQRNKDFHR